MVAVPLRLVQWRNRSLISPPLLGGLLSRAFPLPWTRCRFTNRTATEQKENRIMITSRTLGLGLAAAALVSLAPARPAAAQAPPLSVSSHNYVYTVAFTTPTPFLSYPSGGIHFQFSPSGPAPAVATITGGNLTYSNDWKLNIGGVTTFGDAKPGYSFSGPITGAEVTIGNSTAANGFTVPVTNWGTSFGFTFIYADPPGTDPSDFSLALQAPGQADASLLDLQFSPSGSVTLISSAAGVSVTPQGNAPTPVPAVPEASTTVSLGLLLALGLGGTMVAAKRKKAAHSGR